MPGCSYVCIHAYCDVRINNSTFFMFELFLHDLSTVNGLPVGNPMCVSGQVFVLLTYDSRRYYLCLSNPLPCVCSEESKAKAVNPDKSLMPCGKFGRMKG